MRKERKRVTKERERLSYRLLEGETRHYTERLKCKLSWSFYPAKNKSRGVVLMLHGVASNGSRWEEFAETSFIHNDWDIIRTDLRGHAGSVSSVLGTLDIWSEDIKAILDDAKQKNAIVIAHSLGAQVAMRLVTRHPECFKGLILLDPLVTQAFTQKTIDLRRTRKFVLTARFCGRAMNLLGLHRRIIPQNLREKDAEARKMLASGKEEEVKAFIKRYSSPKFDVKLIHLAQYANDILACDQETPDSSAFTFPTLVLGASNGTYTDAKIVKEWVEAMPQGTMGIVHCAHWPLTECPDEVASQMKDWFDKTFE